MSCDSRAARTPLRRSFPSLKLKSVLSVGLVLLGGGSAQAAMTVGAPSPGLAGTTDFDAWPTLTAAAANAARPVGANTYPGFPGSGAWPAPIGSQAGGDANLNKVANGPGGGPYPASGSIYYGGFNADLNYDGGKLSVTDITPVAGVKNVVFQIQIGEAWTYDFYNDVLPTLKYNGSASAGAPAYTTLVEQFYNGTVAMPTGDEAVYINTWLLQWDVSSLGAISDLTVEWNGVQHAQIYAIRLDQSDEFSAVTVPEPGIAGLLSLGLIPLMRRKRRAIGAGPFRVGSIARD